MTVDRLTLEIYHSGMDPTRVRQVVVEALHEEFGDPDATVDMRVGPDLSGHVVALDASSPEAAVKSWRDAQP